MRCSHVVLIEEYDDLRDAMADLLRFEGETVMAFRDVDAARRALQEAPQPCVIVLSIEASSSSGMTFLRELRSHPLLAGVHVIATSTASELEVLGEEDGVSWFLKPFDPDVLVRTVKERCRNGGT